MTDSELKVNDKRMFTADGELREEFRHLEEPGADGGADGSAAATPSEEPAPEREAEAATPAASVDDEERSSDASPPVESAVESPVESPEEVGSPEEAGFLNLVGLLADHAAVYLGETPVADGKTMLDLRAAHAHIDLLDVLRRKTAGNLSEQESNLLADVLYRLRLAYVDKRRQEA